MSSQVKQLIININDVIVQPLIAFMFVLAVLLFVWGIVEFIWKADSDTERETGKQHMIWGIIGLFIMVSAFSIIKIFVNTFGIDTAPLEEASTLFRGIN